MAAKTSNLIDVAAQFLSSIAGRGCYLVLQVFLARTLGPRDFGLYAIGWTVAGLVSTFSPIGMPQAVLRFGIAGRHSLRSAPVLATALAGLVCFLFMLLAADPIADHLFGDPAAAPVIMALAPSVPLFGVLAVMMSALRASHANLSSALMGGLVFVLYLVLTLGAFWGGLGRTPAVAGATYAIAIVLTLLPSAWLLHRRPPGEPTPVLRHLMRFGLVTMFIHSANVLNLWADRVVIGVMADASAVGLYQVASQLAMIVVVLRSAVTSVFEARVPKAALPGAMFPDVTRDFLAASRILLHIVAPGLVYLSLTAPFWTGVLFGHDYLPAAVPLAVLLIGQLGLTFTGPAATALHMTGEEQTVMRLTLATCVLNVLGNIAVIPAFGLMGSAAVTGLVNIVVGGFSLWRLQKTGRLRSYFRGITDIALATAIAAGVTVLATQWAGTASFVPMAGIAVVSYVTYGAVVAVFCREEDEMLEALRAVGRRAHGLLPRLRAP